MTGPPSTPPPANTTVTVPLSSGGGMKRLLGGGRKGEHRLTLTPQEVIVEHGALREPLRFAPGSVAVATVDPGPADTGKVSVGRFPVLRRLSTTTVVPQDQGIEGWMWTSVDSSVFATLSDEAPNIAFVFSPPLPAERIENAFAPDMLVEIAKRSPLGQPALFGLLLRGDNANGLQPAFERYGFRTQVTDREVPPTQRRHLVTDKPANPEIAGGIASDRASTSIPPPGVS